MNPPKIGFVSLGCPKALVDSERILTELKTEGYELVDSYQESQLVIVNTCGFIDSAKEESLNTIGEALEENGKVIVTGCLGANAENITSVHPKVLSVSGPQAYEQVVGAVKQHIPYDKPYQPFVDLVPKSGIKLTPRHYAYIKIAEGCNHKCSFCIIPSMRGKLVSRPSNEILSEAEGLLNAGVKELLIVSQDTSAYGADIKYRTTFHGGQAVRSKLEPLCDGLFSMSERMGIESPWLRLHYLYPYPNVDEIVPLMAAGKVLPYLDIPFQHSSPSILKAMKRPGDKQNILERISRWRKICPDLTIRSTFIIGFPGETDEDFEHLLQFLEDAQLDRVGAFTYSPVEGATANELANHVDESLKIERHRIFMQTQTQISERKLLSKQGKIIDVLIDEISDDGYVARSKADAPEIDGLVYLESDFDHAPGDIVRVKVIGSDEHDLWAVSCS